MSHELENFKDMTYVGEVPWHGLGVKVDKIDKLPPCLDWPVETQPIYLEGGVEIPGQVAIVRPTDKRVFGLATDGYVPHQNQQLWETFVNFCNEGDMAIETAGSLKGGEIVWILAKVLNAKPISVGSDLDKTDLYALLGSGHNNKIASFNKATSVRVVCNNTLNIALNDGKTTERQVHKSEFDVSKAKDFVSSAIIGFKNYEELANKLVGVPIHNEALTLAYAQELLQPIDLNKAIIGATEGKLDLKNTKKEWIDAIFTNSAREAVFKEVMAENINRPVENMLDSFVKEKSYGDNWWTNFNGVTRYVDHVRSRTSDTRLYNAWFGSGAVIKNEGFKKALEYAEVS